MGTYKGFTSVELRKPKRSMFDLSHERRLSTRMGKLTPIFITETMPNDTFKMNSEVMLRLAPLIAPIMHRVNVFVHFFFVPNRLLWKNWESFITGGRLGTETPPVPPNSQLSTVLLRTQQHLDTGSLADYLGVPPIADASSGTWGTATIDLMPHAAYYRCWYDYYRDRNYTPDNTYLPLSDGTLSDSTTIDALFAIKYRAWEHDYFTSALPWVQRGNQVLMPLSGTGNVTYLPTSLVRKSDGTSGTTDRLLGLDTAGTGTPPSSGTGLTIDLTAAGVPASTAQFGRIENIQSVNLTSSNVSINDLRRAVRLQEWLERNALAGSRYNESIMAHFGRKTSDSRLQRAEYLGGGKVNVKISEVVTTAYSSDGVDVVPPANMSGHGISLGNSNRFSYNCEEHGFVVGIMSVMPSSAYMQGIPRMFTRRNTFLDYPWPSFAHLGEQEVYNNELYVTPTSVPADRTTAPVFGYQSRYADWKHISSSSHGVFRSNLDFWHLTRKFASQPVLGATFVTFEDTLQNRVFAVSDADTLWCYIYNNVRVVRALPYFGTPML